MGSSVNEMNRLTSTEVVTVTAKGRNHSPASTAHEGHGHEHGHDGERGGSHGQTDLRRAVARSGDAVFTAFQVPHDVFAHHDGIVDEHTNGQRQPQQRHEIEREACQPHCDECGDAEVGSDRR